MPTTMLSSAAASTAKSVKSYSKLQKNFAMTPRFSVASPNSTAAAQSGGAGGSTAGVAGGGGDPAPEDEGPNPPGTQNFDPNARSQSIGIQHRTPIGETLVTILPKRRPTGWPDELGVEPEFDRDEEARQRRRRIEAALRMYPRNTFGPTTRWGWLEDIPDSGVFKEREHFKDSHGISYKDRIEKEKIQKRDIEYVRNWTKYKDPVHLWENDREAHKSLAYGNPQDQWARDAEKMLHAQNDQRIAKIKKEDSRKRSISNIKEFYRLERREVEYVKKIEDEIARRKMPGARKIKSSVNYNILAPDFKPLEETYHTKLKKWRAMMRALRIQAKQSGARMYDVISWKPQKPCRVPQPKPELGDIPEVIPPETVHSHRKQSPPRPRNMLHGLDRVEDVPIAPNEDCRTDW